MEQKVPYDLEIIIDEEKEAHNYLIMLGETPIGHIRYRALPEKKYKVERFCILKEYRDKGYGKKVFNYFLDYLGAQFNPCVVCFDGQAYLKEFYESCGCVTIGDKFMEAGIEHYYMEKKY
jgi:predicted GNAT family N-acyltransferase